VGERVVITEEDLSGTEAIFIATDGAERIQAAPEHSSQRTDLKLSNRERVENRKECLPGAIPATR
jgi:hypothetical protein